MSHKLHQLVNLSHHESRTWPGGVTLESVFRAPCDHYSCSCMCQHSVTMCEPLVQNKFPRSINEGPSKPAAGLVGPQGWVPKDGPSEPLAANG
jgi:hypothetical protein